MPVQVRAFVASGGLIASLVGAPAQAAHVKVVYSFAGGGDGAQPYAQLINVGGTLYGTTEGGGGSTACLQGCGTVFSVTPQGKETVLYAFKGGTDGAEPVAGLINQGGTLYGTTFYGGSGVNCAGGYPGCGIVFSVTPDGVENVVYSFQGSKDGAYPDGGLTDVGGVLYGTTYGGGDGVGTVFSLAPGGVEKIIHRFKALNGTSPDGAGPTGELIEMGGKLFGTCTYGGIQNAGTVFSVAPDGHTTVKYRFDGNDGSIDAQNPTGTLVKLNGVLYGTSKYGGSISCGNLNCGTAFSVTTDGTETVLHSFGSNKDGTYPFAGLVKVGDALFGTTVSGVAPQGNGTVFSLTPAGAETIIDTFHGGDGENPMSALIKVGGRLYGTTNAGGASGVGTVYSIKSE